MATQTPEPVLLPPSPFIRRLGDMLDANMALDILDVGCCSGRNAVYLAKLGHSVIGLNDKYDDLAMARAHNQPSLHLVAGDARHPMFHKLFDVVLINEVLHQLPFDEKRTALEGLKKLTKPGGFHAVSDYLANDSQGALDQFELYDMYARGGWNIIDYYEDEQKTHFVGNNQEVLSLATIIAEKV